MAEEAAALDDLLGMALPMVGVELEQLPEGHGAPLGVAAFAAPVGGGRGPKDRRRGLAEIPKGVQRRAPVIRVALPVSEPRGPDVLVVARKDREALGQDLSDPYRADGLRVGDVDHDLLDRPLAGNRMAPQLFFREPVQSPRDPVGGGGVSLEKGRSRERRVGGRESRRRVAFFSMEHGVLL